MRVVNRTALIVRYREPYLKWAASLDEKAPIHAADLHREVSVYLIPENDGQEDNTAQIEKFFEQIFVQELEGWWLDEARWPPKRDFATFQQWFEVHVESVVTDLGTGPLEVEEM